MKSKKFVDVVDESEINSYQILVSELDTTLDRMRCVSLSEQKDAYEMQQFNSFWEEVKNNESVVVAINDNSNLYELSDDSTLVVLSEDLNNKMIIFDKQDSQNILNKIMKK